MRAKQKCAFEALGRMVRFVRVHARELEAVIRGTVFRKADDMARLAQQLEREQYALGARLNSATLRHRMLVDALLRRHVRPIVAIATVRGVDMPGCRRVKLPSNGLSNAQVVRIAVISYQAVAGYRQLFIDEGLSVDFHDQLSLAITATREASERRRELLERKCEVRGEIERLYSAQRKVARALDALVRARFAGSARLTRAWGDMKGRRVMVGVRAEAA